MVLWKRPLVLLAHGMGRNVNKIPEEKAPFLLSSSLRGRILSDFQLQKNKNGINKKFRKGKSRRNHHV